MDRNAIETYHKWRWQHGSWIGRRSTSRHSGHWKRIGIVTDMACGVRCPMAGVAARDRVRAIVTGKAVSKRHDRAMTSRAKRNDGRVLHVGRYVRTSVCLLR